MSAPHHLRTLFTLGPERLGIARGLRAATATVVPIVLADVLHQPPFAWMALGGWMCSLADGGGPYGSRARAMTIFAAGATLSSFAASVSARHTVLAVGLMFAWALGTGLARAYGDSATTVGNLIAGVLVGTLGSTAASAAAAGQRAAFVLAGCVWAMLLGLGLGLGLVLWPLQPYGPAQRSLARCYAALESYAEEILALLHERRPRRAAWNALARRGPARVRTTIEDTAPRSWRRVAVASGHWQ